MDNQVSKIALGVLVLIFFLFGILFRRKIAYLFCPLPRYTGKINKGKTHYLFLIHFFVSLGLTIMCYIELNEYKWISIQFEDFTVRILTILAFWLIFFFITGLLIELYLFKTDKEYSSWKKTNSK